jgi:Domain of unknown function (DUF6431)
LDAGGLGIFGLLGSKTTPAHPRLKIVPCPFCNHPKCHRHGRYFRKATHQVTGLIWVQRFFCRPCGGTHSILPDGLLPICRWHLGNLLVIVKRFSRGETAYAIARSLLESLASLLHLKGWLANAGALLEILARECGLLVQAPPRPPPANAGAALTLAYRWPTWPEFAHVFSRAFYPKRFPLLSSHTILTG